jgi:hypothetical protein
MASKTDFTPEEWKALAAGPLLAGMYVSLAQPSWPVGVVKEGMAVVKEIIGATGSSNELVAALAQQVRASGPRDMPDVPADREKARGELLSGVKKAMAAAGKSAADGEAYGQWVYAAAQKAAEAAKEGGFLGFGGTVVSEAETAALAELKTALGVKV